MPASGSLGRVSGVALLLAGVLLAAAELGWRRHGLQPSVKDSPELWSLERARVAEEERALVLLGSSRFQAGLVPEVLSEALGGASVVQLSINGASSLPLLEDIAQEEDFRGLVLCEVSPTFFFSVGPDEVRTRPAQYVARHHERPFVADWETAMRLPLQERLVVLQSAVHPKNVVRHLLVDRALPAPYFSRTLASRQQLSDFAGMDVSPLRAMWAREYRERHGRAPEPAEREALLERVASAVERIRARGGDVVFVRMVASGEVRRLEDERFPREQYWNPLIQRTGKGLAFEDVPELARFECPEDSHLDYRATPEFTRLLARELRRLAARSTRPLKFPWQPPSLAIDTEDPLRAESPPGDTPP